MKNFIVCEKLVQHDISIEFSSSFQRGNLAHGQFYDKCKFRMEVGCLVVLSNLRLSSGERERERERERESSKK